MESEKTPLVGGEQGSFYFTRRAPKQGGSTSASAAGSDDTIEPLVERESDPVEADPVNADLPNGQGGESWWPFRPKETKSRNSINKLRKVPVKVEPKVYFSNERTFIAWVHMAVTLSTIAIAILAFARHNPWSQVYGLVVLPVAVVFIGYALYQFMRRGKLIHQRAPGPYEDHVGPVVLGTMLMASIICNVAIKMYEMYS